MKKICSLLFVFAILSSALSIPAFAQESNRVDMMAMDNSTSNATMSGYGTDRALNMNANNYRTNAATDDNNNNWGWIGLLGLAGLFGLRKSNRERT